MDKDEQIVYMSNIISNLINALEIIEGDNFIKDAYIIKKYINYIKDQYIEIYPSIRDSKINYFID